MKQKFSSALSLALIMAMLFTSVGLADNVQNDVVAVDGDKIVTITAGGSATVNYRIASNSGDGETGCNATVASPASVAINAPIGVTASPSSLTFTSCGTNQPVVFSSDSEGSHEITVTVSDSGAGTYNTNPGIFTLVVNAAPPTNTAPSVSVTGVTNSAVYNKGSVPAALCQVTDVQDGNSSFPATLSEITGPYASDGIGSQTASCSYTDGGGLSDSDTATYSIIDPSGPSISYTVNGVYPAVPNGLNGWYTSDVFVDWTVSDPDSAVTINEGCADTSINTDTPGTTLTCTATSAGGTSGPVSVMIKRDATAPINVTGAPNRVPDNGTWYNQAVDVVFAGEDATSGIASCTTANYSGPDGSGRTVNGSCTDHAGNTSAAVASSSFNYDGTAPTNVVLSVTAGTLGLNSWYTSDVTVSTTSDDDASGVTCTADQTLTTESAGVVFNGSCTNGAGLTTADAPLTVKLDKTGPLAALQVTAGTAGANGWYTSDVTVSTSGSDDISGPVTCSANQNQTDETAGTQFNGSCTNQAGLSTNAAPLTVKLDKTGPSAALQVTAGTAGTNGWYTSDVTISTSGSDNISGIATCTADQYQTAETAGTPFNGSCTNQAGLSTNAAPLTVKLDKSGPSAALQVTAGTLGNNGWYIDDVTVSTSGDDDISGPAVCAVDQFLTTDSAGTEFNGSCTNEAGLSTNAAPLTVKRDASAPTSISFVGGPTAGGSYYFGSVPAAPTCTADGALSGLASCSVDGYGTGVGSYTMTATATDNAGNVGTATSSYTVLAWTIQGFYAPVDRGIHNIVKGGATVPLKFEVFAGSTELTNTSFIQTFTQRVNCTSGTGDDIEQYATGGTSLRYDTVSGQFIFNWQTPRQPGACYRVTMTTSDGSSIYADFRLK